MNYCILRSNNTISEQIVRENTIYEVHNVFDLKGGTLNMPSNSVLFFKGGNISNGTIIGNNTAVEATQIKIFDSDITILGTWSVQEAYPEWFGAKGDKITDDRQAIQNAIDIGKTIILDGNYLIKNAPFNWTGYPVVPDNESSYYLDLISQKDGIQTSTLTPLIIPSNKTIVLRGSVKAYSPLGDLIQIIGSNSKICGKGTVEGCGLVSTINTHNNIKDASWYASLIHIEGRKNTISGITIKNPTTCGVLITDYYSSYNTIMQCVFGGGLKQHTKRSGSTTFTKLFGVLDRGTRNTVEENIFKEIDGKNLYSALYADYQTTNVPANVNDRDTIHTFFRNNDISGCYEHAVYSYAKGCFIENNRISDCSGTALQLFHGYNKVFNNSIIVPLPSQTTYILGVHCSGEYQVVKHNTIKNTTGYGIRIQGYYNGSCDYCIIEDNYIEQNLNGMVSANDIRPYPAISVESSAFRDNKLTIDHVTIKGNKVICTGTGKTRTVARGILSVSGDPKSLFNYIDICDNLVLGSTINNEISVVLNNESKKTVVNIQRNNLISETVPNSIYGDGSIFVTNAATVNCQDNIIKHLGTVKGIANSGTAFFAQNVDCFVFSGNTVTAKCNNNQWYSGYNSKIIAHNNIINGLSSGRRITIPQGQESVILSMPVFGPMGKKWQIKIYPENASAKMMEKTGSVRIEQLDAYRLSVGHAAALKEESTYWVEVEYKM